MGPWADLVEKKKRGGGAEPLVNQNTRTASHTGFRRVVRALRYIDEGRHDDLLELMGAKAASEAAEGSKHE